MSVRTRTAKNRKAPPAPRLDWAYFLDVDGTLIEFAETPGAAHVDDALLGLVARFHRACGGALALVSGRALADLEYRLGSVRIPLAGQHGLERRDSHERVRLHAAPAAARRDLHRMLAPILARHAGLLLEDKGIAVALHYRQAPRLAGYLHRVLRDWLAGSGTGLQMQRGKRVLEIKPAGFDKGTAIGEFMNERPFCGRRPVFIGDDATDENGFAMVNRLGGHSIKVGAGQTVASWRLRDVAAVRAWLGQAIEDEGERT